MRYITAVIFASLATILVVAYAYPTYESTTKLKDRVVELKSYVDKAQKAQIKINDLENRYRMFPDGANERMNKMLPETIDDIRLTIDITDLATSYGLSLANPSIKKLAVDKNNSLQPYMVSFAIEASYRTFRLFLKDLEYWLQLRDITSLSITPGETATAPMQIRMDFITYSMQ
jgi:cell division protein FtsL